MRHKGTEKSLQRISSAFVVNNILETSQVIKACPDTSLLLKQAISRPKKLQWKEQSFLLWTILKSELFACKDKSIANDTKGF